MAMDILLQNGANPNDIGLLDPTVNPRNWELCGNVRQKVK